MCVKTMGMYLTVCEYFVNRHAIYLRISNKEIPHIEWCWNAKYLKEKKYLGSP